VGFWIAKLDVVLVTALREAKRLQRKLFEPGGRVLAAAVEQALGLSKTVYSQKNPAQEP